MGNLGKNIIIVLYTLYTSFINLQTLTMWEFPHLTQYKFPLAWYGTYLPSPAGKVWSFFLTDYFSHHTYRLIWLSLNLKYFLTFLLISTGVTGKHRLVSPEREGKHRPVTPEREGKHRPVTPVREGKQKHWPVTPEREGKHQPVTLVKIFEIHNISSSSTFPLFSAFQKISKFPMFLALLTIKIC